MLTKEFNILDNTGNLRIECPVEVSSLSRIFMYPTLVFRNCISRSQMPYEWFACKNKDMLFTSFLGNFGGNIHIPQLNGSIYNMNPFSTWNSISPEQKALERFYSIYAIMLMNLRLGNKEAVDALQNVIIKNNLPKKQKLKIFRKIETEVEIAKHYTLNDLEFEIL